MKGELDTTEVPLTGAELMIVNNALNEVVNGIEFEDAEFQTRLGATREEARRLLDRIHRVLEGYSVT